MSAPTVEAHLNASVAPLSELLKTHTAAAHTEAEESTFVADMIEGRLDTAAVVSLLAQSLVIYRAFESTLLKFAGHPQLGGFIDPKLNRVAALEQDLAFHFGADFEAMLGDGRIAVVPATHAYVERLTTAGDDSVELLLAHHYVRYMGDLSGGQIIQRMVQRHYGIADEGLNFYAFTEIPKPKPYKDAYRERLNGTVFTPEQTAAILEFASESFEMNRAVFVDLAAERAAVAAR